MKKLLRIKEVIAEKGMTQKELAEKMGLNPVAFGVTLNSNPTVKTLQKIAEALGVEISELFVQNNFHAFIAEGENLKYFKSREELKEYLG